MKNQDKIILDLCGGTGSWSEPYKKAGYDVRVITLPGNNVLMATYDDQSIFFPGVPVSAGQLIDVKKVYGILAAPPCTMFSRARTTGGPRDYRSAMLIVQACLKIIWACRTHGKLKFWALENPMGMLRQFLGNPGYSFRGWEFGDQHVKFTDLWGYFDHPAKLRSAKRPRFNKKKWATPKKPKKYEHLKLDRAGIRAITPPKFALAFYKANK